MQRSLRALALVAALAGVAPSALAQETRPGTLGGGRLLLDDQKSREPLNTEPPLGIFPTPADALMDPRMARSWAALPSRWFVSTTVDVGFVYARPRVSFGYGRPFTQWIGIDANPVASGAGVGAYGGLRFALPFGDLRIGPRYFYAFNHTVLDVKKNYDRIDLETSQGSPGRTLTYEAELDGSIPVGPGSVLLRGSVSYVTGVDENHEVFEETLRVIVRPPLVWRARGGYAFRFGAYNQHSIGVVVDILDVPKRDDSITTRIGPVMRLVLSRRVELRGSFVVTVTSPDRIGLIGGDFTELGVRYRWASE
ncbi:MAG TPA: hypothetical protein VH062_19885 [Polyangiaceae bacterium]|jgi:hypothetical protein|nr:hypothetical protein [Polyangiaceae bacterium]